MAQPGAETRAKLAEIESSRKRLKEQLEKTQGQLDWIVDNGIPESNPYVTFKPVTQVKDLAGPPLGIRAALTRDLDELKRTLADLKKEARLVRTLGSEEAQRRKGVAVRQADRRFEAHARRVLDAAAQRGHLTDEELAELQVGSDATLESYVELMHANPNEQAIRDVLNQLAESIALGGGDPDGAQARAVSQLGVAGKQLFDRAKQKFAERPSQKGARELLRSAANSALLGDEASTPAAVEQLVGWLGQQSASAEARFRGLPSAENAARMFEAEGACVRMGGAALANPPRGLHRVKPGDSHRIAPGESLSRISMTYYGNPGYWDVIARANPNLLQNPDRPPVGTTIVIP